MSAIEKVKGAQTFVEECWAELLKVTWPDWDQLRSATLVVIVFTIAISLVIWLMDSTASWVLNRIIGLFGA